MWRGRKYHMKGKKMFIEGIRERSCEFYNLEKNINLANLIYGYKGSKKSERF